MTIPGRSLVPATVWAAVPAAVPADVPAAVLAGVPAAVVAATAGVPAAQQLRPQGGDLLAEVGERARVVHHEVGDGQPAGPAGLRVHPGPGLIRRHAAQPGQPVLLD